MIKKIFILLMLMTLMGCEKKLTYSYSYLVEHPATLKNQVTLCQAAVQKSADEVAQCELTMRAAADLMTVIDQQQQDPEGFGQQVIDAEINGIELKNNLQHAQASLAALKAKQASPAELQTAQTQVEKAQMALNEQRQKIKMMLAVIGINSPE